MSDDTDRPYVEGPELQKGDLVGVEIDGKVYVDTYNPPAVRPTDEELADWTVEYAVAHPVTGEPRFARESLEDCREYAQQFDTHVIHRRVGPWQDGEPT